MIERLLAADAALERGELEVAERLFTQVAGADPRNAIAVVGLARVAMRRESRAEAAELAHRALHIDPDEAAAHRLLVELEAPEPVAASSSTPERTAASSSPPTPPSPPPAAELAVPQPPARSVPAPSLPRPWWRRLLARILGRG